MAILVSPRQQGGLPGNCTMTKKLNHRSHCCMHLDKTTLLSRSNPITTRKPAAARNSTHPQPCNPLVYFFTPLHLLAYLQHPPLQLVEHHLPSDAATGCSKNNTSFSREDCMIKLDNQF